MRRFVPLILCALVAAGCAAADTSSEADSAVASGTTGPPPESETTSAPDTVLAAAATTTTTAASPTTAAPTTAAPTTAAAPTTTVPDLRVPITIGFGGDTSFTHGLHARDPLGQVAALLQAPDLTVLNLETVVAEQGVGTPEDKRFVFKSPPSSVDLLVEAGVDVVSLGNNHSLDYGLPGIERTVELLDAHGILHGGAGVDAAAAYEPIVTTVGEWSLGIVALTRVPCDWSNRDPTARVGAAWTCDPFVDEVSMLVEQTAVTTDYTVVFVHWGIELDHCPQPYQRELAAAWSAAGVDLVVGGHPHVLQGIERIDETWVIHSVGNFAFPSARNTSAWTAFFTVHLDPDSGAELSMEPLFIADGRPRPMSEGAAAQMRQDFSSWSFGYAVADDGLIVPTDATGVCG